MDEQISNSGLHIEGFDFERRDRALRAGDGIMVYIFNNISYKSRNNFEISNIETIWLALKIKNSKLIYYCSAYRPPSAPVCWAEDLAREIKCASCCDDAEIIITGDFNLDLLQDHPPPHKFGYVL